ncbi:MAG: bifunctional molybdenum cofactor biosynthesis protein MoaC/MoaB [Candidatus Omnitrophica bacterium]|nr:bifunctional molybdenum cofactor biosynthesis protein MoaC/MoaB [Candidatus Omnitrophota bacterium]
MFDITDKIKTLRVSKARAVIEVDEDLIKKIERREIEKGDIFEISRAVACQSAKKTSEIFPFCHNIPIEWVFFEHKIDGKNMIIEVTVKTISRTGCEMEALFSVSCAALNIYDMLKPYSKNIEIKEIKLVEKKGGKSDFIEELPTPFKAGVLVVSDSVYAGKKEDKSGKIIVKILKECGVENIEYKIVPDEKEMIEREVKNWIDEEFNLVITTGGTGLSPRDVTPEAIRPLIEKEIPAIMEASRVYGYERTPYSMLSRGISGVSGKTLIITLPGSSKGSYESMRAIFPYVFHIYKMMEGRGHEK